MVPHSLPHSFSPPSHLKFVEAEGKVEYLSELFGQGLFSLQVLHGSVGRARQRLQQATQGILYIDT